MTARNEGWRNDTCPGCGKSGWCQQHNNGTVICRRGPFPGSQERQDRAGVPLWVSAPLGLAPARVDFLSSPVLADPQALHLVYCTLLSELTLHRRHRRDLRRRGLTDEAIERHQIRSWPGRVEERAKLARTAVKLCGSDCSSVPGFFSDSSRPMLAGGSGWVLPFWNLEGRVVALKIRSDRADANPKYYWLSSARRGGLGPGQHARLAWPGRRLRLEDHEPTIRVTEGEAKAIVLAEGTGVPTLSVPGVSNWMTALPWLAKLRASRVLLCFDADFVEKREVARALLAARDGFQTAGYDVSLETWGDRWEVRHVAS